MKVASRDPRRSVAEHMATREKDVDRRFAHEMAALKRRRATSVEWTAPQQPEGITFDEILVIMPRRATIFARRFWTSPHYAVVGFSMDEKAHKAENRTHHRDRLEADRADDPPECF